MATGLPDLVEVKRLAEEGAALAREYALRDLPRLKDLLAADDGTVNASFAFSKWGSSGRAVATITVEAEPTLLCQRCSQRFGLPVHSTGELEFVASEDEKLASEREPYLSKGGMVSLREMAEEELLMALPAAASCSSPQTCGSTAPEARASRPAEPALEARRPFAGLKELLKKT